MTSLRWPSSAWPLLLAFMLGCSRPDTVEVTGTVTWEGAPIPHGEVAFFSVDPHIPAAAGRISDGTFQFRSKPGQKRVEIRSVRLSKKLTPQGRPIGEMYIPVRYNSESILTEEVTLDGENNFNFPLKLKP